MLGLHWYWRFIRNLFWQRTLRFQPPRRDLRGSERSDALGQQASACTAVVTGGVVFGVLCTGLLTGVVELGVVLQATLASDTIQGYIWRPAGQPW